MSQTIEQPARFPAPADDPSATGDTAAPSKPASPDPDGAKPTDKTGKKKHRNRRWSRRTLYVLLVLALFLGVARAMLPWAVRSYVNRTIDQSPLYDGQIGDVDIHLWRGAYAARTRPATAAARGSR
jgi:hypothetical protein